MSLLDGRGRWYRYDKKDLVTDFRQLPISKVSKSLDLQRRYFTSWAWWSGDRKTADILMEVVPNEGVRVYYSVNGEKVTPYLVPITTTSPNYGGVRYWWLCPLCRRRCAILYLGRHFRCRQCWNLTYETAQKGGDLMTTIDNRLLRIQGKLQGAGGVCDGPWPKPPHMRWTTYSKLACEYMNLLDLRRKAFTCAMYEIALGPSDEEFPIDSEDMQLELKQQWQYFKDAPHSRSLWQYAISGFEDVKTPKNPKRLTLGEIADLAEVPYAFALEVQNQGLITPDRGRGSRRKRYRRKLHSWLKKLWILRQSGMGWGELYDWSKRRFQPGHEDEVYWPYGADLEAVTR